jgi:hypothetical protein
MPVLDLRLCQLILTIKYCLMTTQNHRLPGFFSILRKSLVVALVFVLNSCTAQRLATRTLDVKELDNINHRITPEQAKALTGKYGTGRGSWSKRTMPLSEAFNKRSLDSLLNQPNCVGMRICFGMDEKGQIRLILYGINDQGKDIGSITSQAPGKDFAKNSKQKGSDDQNFTGEVILESGQRCPDICPN